MQQLLLLLAVVVVVLRLCATVVDNLLCRRPSGLID